MRCKCNKRPKIRIIVKNTEGRSYYGKRSVNKILARDAIFYTLFNCIQDMTTRFSINH